MAVIMIEEPRRADGSADEGAALWRLGFRPFYLGAAAFGSLAMAGWLLQLTGWLHWPPLDLLWHVHEMVFGMVVAVVVGFLYTAGRNWTNLWTPRGSALAALFGLWLAGRVAMLAAPGWVAMLIDLAFLPVAAWPLYRVMQQAGNVRNRFLPLMLVLLAAFNLVYHLAARDLLSVSPLRVAEGAVMVIVVIASVIGTRVIPMFTRNGAPGTEPQSSPRLDQVNQGLLAAMAVAWLGNWEALGVPIAVAAGALVFWRVWRWQIWATFGVPLLWVLHLSYAWIGVGCCLLAATWIGLVPVTAAMHAFTVGAIGGLIIGMMTRTSLGHTGRQLRAGGVETTMYLLLQVAAVTRVLAAVRSEAWLLLLGGSTFWLGFALFVASYAGKLCRPRVDGREG